MNRISFFLAVVLIILSQFSASCSDNWHWIETNFPSEYFSYAGTSYENSILITSYNSDECTGHVLKSSDCGDSWNIFHSFDQSTYLTSIVSFNNGLIFLMSFNCDQQRYEVLKSSNLGETWQPTAPIPIVDTHARPYNVKVWQGVDNTLFVITDFEDLTDVHLLSSIDYGETWVPSCPFPERAHVSTFNEVSAGHYLIGSIFGKIFESFDYGNSWEVSSLPADFEVSSIKCVDQERCLAGTHSVMILWAREWTSVAWYELADLPYVFCLYLSSQSVFYAATGGVYKSSDIGLTWEEMIVDSTDVLARGIFEGDDGYLYITGGFGVLRSSEPITPPTFTPTVGPGTPTNTPHPPTFTPTPSPSHTPTITPTPQKPTQPPIPTPSCDRIGVTLDHPDGTVKPGNLFFIDAEICNTLRHPLTGTLLFAILEIEGSFWFYPSWDSKIDYLEESWNPGITTRVILPEFAWPDGIGTGVNAIFWAALVNPTMTSLIGDYDSWEFSW